MIIQGRDYEHTLAIPREAAPICYRPTELGPAIQAILKREPFDAAEFTLAGTIILKDREEAAFTALPIFPARSFFHSCLWVRQDLPLTRMEDLAGKRIGLRDYTSTTSIWFRGHLKAAHGVDWATIAWVVGPNRRFPPPPEADVALAGGDLEDLLIANEIDAFFSVRVRDQKEDAAARKLRPLLADPYGAEAAYYRESGLFPLLHVIVVSNAAASADPAAPRAIFDVFEAAKKAALTRKIGSTFVPWGEPNWERTMPAFGGDPLPYGLTQDNRRNIETLVTYLLDQKLIRRRPSLEDLFHPGSSTWHEAGRAS